MVGELLMELSDQPKGLHADTEIKGVQTILLVDCKCGYL